MRFGWRLVGLALGLALVACGSIHQVAYPPRPMLRFDQPLAFDCGPWERGTHGRHGWAIVNEGASPVSLRTRFTSGRSGFSLWQDRPTLIRPGEKVVVHLNWVTPDRDHAPFASYVILWTNDPLRPIVRLRVVGRSRGPLSP